MLVDSHCHLDRLILKDYENNLEKALEAAWSVGVEYILNVSVTLKDSPKVLAIAKAHPKKIGCAVGLHPSEPAFHEPSVNDILQCADDELVIAIGETGLDYHYDDISPAVQQARLRTHIRAAKEAKKPLVMHMRNANVDLLEILKKEKAEEVGGIMHCFTGDWEEAKKVLDLGFYLGFSGIITFKNAHQLREVAKKAPIDRILVETDAPYLAPVPFRGKANEPVYVRYVAEYMADLLNMRYDEFADKSTENFYRLFNVKVRPA